MDCEPAQCLLAVREACDTHASPLREQEKRCVHDSWTPTARRPQSEVDALKLEWDAMLYGANATQVRHCTTGVYEARTSYTFTTPGPRPRRRGRAAGRFNPLLVPAGTSSDVPRAAAPPGPPPVQALDPHFRLARDGVAFQGGATSRTLFESGVACWMPNPADCYDASHPFAAVRAATEGSERI